jgi:hypothetical protein
MKHSNIEKNRRSSQAEVELRVMEVSRLLMEGYGREDIVHFSSQKWDVGKRQTSKYIKASKERIRNSVQKEIEYDYAKAVRRYEELFRLTLERKDYRTSATINKELTALQGLLKQQIEHSGAVEFISNIPE